MESTVKFYYTKEYWYISAFLNSEKVNIEDVTEKIKTLLTERLGNLTESDFTYLDRFRNAQERRRKLVDMGKNISIECSWVSYFTGFSYTSEKRDFTFGTDPKPLIFDSLGYFEFKIEYFTDSNVKSDKESIEPILIQQISFMALKVIEKFCAETENEYLLIDCESKIYDMVISNKTDTVIKWTKEEIKNHKRDLGYWIEIHSGGWEDYSDELFDRRIECNLSNRTSELHFLCRNSGFIYMEEENYEKYFDYMEKNVLESTAEIRAMQFALMSINDSLDVLFKKRHGIFMSLKRLEEKIKQLRHLKGTIQTNLSLIYNEVDWNRRQHYTSVLMHLLEEFRLEEIFKRVDSKFDLLEESLQQLYFRRKEIQKTIREKTLTLLSFLFSLGIVADITTLIMNTFALQLGYTLTFYVNAIMLTVIVISFIGSSLNYRYKSYKLKEKEKGEAVDAIIEDGVDNVVLIRRKYPPYQGMSALPGGFIEKEKDEEAEEAVIREVEEETNLKVKIKKKVGKYDKKGRDPRDRIVSNVYICTVIEGELEPGDDAFAARWVPIETLKNLELAFDHREMLKDARFI